MESPKKTFSSSNTWLPSGFVAGIVVLCMALARAAMGASGIVIPPGLEERFQAPAGIEWGYFRNADGARLRYCHVPAASRTKGTVVLVTGNREFAEKYFEVMREFRSRGYDTWEMDWRGFGGSDRYLAGLEKGHSLGFDRDARDLNQFVTSVVRATPGRPLFLVAHSMGGNIGLRYLHDYPRRFAFAILSAPALSIGKGENTGIPEWSIRAMIWSACAFGLRSAWAKGQGPWEDHAKQTLTHDAARSQIQNQWFRANAWLRLGGPTNGWVREFFRSCDTLSEARYLGAIPGPILMGSARADSVTQPEVQDRACKLLPGCRPIRVADSWHELFVEADPFRSQWMQALFQFAESNGAK
jgi:lysophospholipase